MRWLATVLLGVALASCGEEGPVNTAQACSAAGGRFVPAPGSAAQCAKGEQEIGQIPYGIEGAICCRKAR